MRRSEVEKKDRPPTTEAFTNSFFKGAARRRNSFPGMTFEGLPGVKQGTLLNRRSHIIGARVGGHLATALHLYELGKASLQHSVPEVASLLSPLWRGRGAKAPRRVIDFS